MSWTVISISDIGNRARSSAFSSHTQAARRLVSRLGEGATATEAVGGWPENVYGPSVIQGDDYPHPKEASVEYTKSVVEAFAASAKRAVQAGIDVIEIRTCFDSSTHDVYDPDWVF